MEISIIQNNVGILQNVQTESSNLFWPAKSPQPSLN